MPSSMLTILTEIKKLTDTEINDLYIFLEETKVNKTTVSSISEEVKEQRFAKGKKCPHCQADKVVRNGKYKGKQRYVCKNCNKTFGDFTNSIVSNSKKTSDKWLNYIKCMIRGIPYVKLQ